MNLVHGSIFSGFGAPDLAALWMGWDNAFWCETDDFCRQILKYWFPQSKGYENIKKTDFTPWRGKIDILTGGFPCQPFSVAGQRKGSADDRYLWPEMLRAIREIRPAWVIGENVAGILSMVQSGSEITVESQTSLFEEADKETLLEEEYVVETICRDLEEEGYSVQPVVIPACAVGAPHRRDRVFFIANRADARIKGLRPERENAVYGFETSTDANRQRFQECYIPFIRKEARLNSRIPYGTGRSWQDFPTQSPVHRGNDGLSFDVVCLTLPLTTWRTGAIKGYGNAIVPQVMYEIFKAIEQTQQLETFK